jgi:hypothetical protein
MLKSETKRGFVSVIAALGAVTLLVLAVENSINGGRHEFQRKVASGQSKDELRSLIGIPQAILKLGDSLEHWGNAPKKTVEAETWVYYAVPQSQHCFVLTFEGDRLAEYHHEQN